MEKLNRIILIAFLFTLLFSCADDEKKHRTPKKSLTEFNAKVINRPDKSDLTIIKQKKQLRILVSEFTENHAFLPRESQSNEYGANLAIQYAKREGLEPVIVYAKKTLLVPALLKGYGDVIASSIVVSDNLAKKVQFSHPVSYTNQQLILPKNLEHDQVNRYQFQMKDFDGMRIGVQKAEVYWETVKKLKSTYKNLTPVIIANQKTPDQVLDSMFNGDFDATFSDTHKIETALKSRENFSIAYTIKEKNAIAWAVRPENPLLLKSINEFIETYRLANDIPSSFKGDFDQIKKTGQLRLITRNNASSYFLWKNKLMGFEYELIKRFAIDHSLTLKVLVANDFEQMMLWLREGRGDIISAGLTLTPEREKLAVLFSIPYNKTEELIVQSSKETAITSTEELAEREFVVRKSSSYWYTLDELQKNGINLKIKEVDEKLDTDSLLDIVSNNKGLLTLVDNNIFQLEDAWRSDLQGSLIVKKDVHQHWLVRQNNPKLVEALNKFLKKHNKSTFYNVTYNKYFHNSRKIFNPELFEKYNQDQVSPYDDLIKQYSDKYKFNWLLISAQMNQESHFDPNAVSLVGAKGLMQIMPKTAKMLQISNLEIPKNAISAGIKYMDWIRRQFKENLSIEDKNWFTLASYNAGVGHVEDARKLAKQLGLDPNRWFGQTEKAMLLLGKNKYAKKARYGYVRGSEPVFYVKQIRQIYQLYQKRFQQQELRKEVKQRSEKN